ncbi:MAG: MarR family transcriptional regulator [Methanoregula sp.]|nr:MarR family transcriptional regulator [Methanoregula sp.]
MRHQSVSFFTDRQEEFVNLLIEIGQRKYVANLLVFLANTPEATPREIERGTDMRQPEVSMAIKYLFKQGWIKSRDIPTDRKGRPKKMYSLAIPLKRIVAAIEKEKKIEVEGQLARVRKMRDYF